MQSYEKNYNILHTPEKPVIKGFSSANLDTLAQLRIVSENTTKITLQKRAYSKWISNEILYPLIDLKNERNPKYWNTYHCNHILQQNEDGKITASYCKNRWCVVCNRIRTAKLIKGYTPVIEKFPDARFVTLTVKHTSESDYEQMVTDMYKNFRRITDWARRKGVTLRGVRKMETTWSKHNGFHPHYHVIVDGEANAEWLINEWVKRNPGSDHKGQDQRALTKSSLIEVFKYFTKLWSDSKDDSGLRLPYPAVIMDEIFRVMAGRRTVQPFGGVKKVSEEITDIEATVYSDDKRLITWLWQQEIKNWLDFSTGEILC